MAEVKVYSYSKCSTCVKALKYLDGLGLKTKVVDITEKPPSKNELKSMLKSYQGELRRLFNTSGQVYRQMGLKDKMKDMTEAEAFNLLSQNGKLVKRPFLLKGPKGLVGFKQEEWDQVFQ